MILCHCTIVYTEDLSLVFDYCPLHAAAPDLLAALDSFTGCTGTGYHRWLERRDAAIARATGTEPADA